MLLPETPWILPANWAKPWYRPSPSCGSLVQTVILFLLRSVPVGPVWYLRESLRRMI